MNDRANSVLVTGGAGFIGSELVRQLAQEGLRVVVLDNLVNGRRENLDGIHEDRVRLIVGDVRDTEIVREAVHGVSRIYHLACLGVRHSIHSPLENHHVNATATLDLLSVARASNVRRFVYVSSSEVYGTARWVPMTEAHPTFPLTVYGSSKLAGECYTRAFHETYGFPTVVVRPFNAYGPRCHHEGDSGEVIPKFILRCRASRPMVVFGDGTQTRDFTYVADTARAIRLAGECDAAVGRTINIGSGAEISINNLAQLVADVTGRSKARVTHEGARPGDVLRLYADASTAHSLLGFEPSVSFREGLSTLASWYDSLPYTAEELLEQEVVRNWDPLPQGGS